ncbi:hypothetical protein [Aeromonas hydrophila]|uniref:hypothetical protein n=1 Tax=Aeromonas hydrophila TaxID=644 RepID=UPI001F61FF1F|nr:hypothetical protein [Aeromonas hydrophila]UNU29927.1 hypothetical protein GCK65_12805 [Aeromonas hydrophila]
MSTTPTNRSVFSIQTENVRELEKAWEQGNRLINESLRLNNDSAVTIQTKLMALLFSAYTEATFSKLIHTPGALTQLEIQKLKDKFKSNSYTGWVTCLKLVVGKITSRDQTYKSEVISKVMVLLEKYIKEPSEVRNRMAHGQWVIALNSKNTQENNLISVKINNLDIVILTKYKKSFHLTALIIEDLLESPDKAHINFYQDLLDKFSREQEKMSTWTIEGRRQKLRPKPRHTTN